MCVWSTRVVLYCLVMAKSVEVDEVSTVFEVENITRNFVNLCSLQLRALDILLSPYYRPLSSPFQMYISCSSNTYFTKIGKISRTRTSASKRPPRAYYVDFLSSLSASLSYAAAPQIVPPLPIVDSSMGPTDSQSSMLLRLPPQPKWATREGPAWHGPLYESNSRSRKSQ